MRFLKLFLYLILSACLIWGGTVVFGPFLVIKLFDYYSDGRILVSKVDISPKLEVRIDRLDITPDNGVINIEKNFIFRGINIRARGIMSQPVVEISSGNSDISSLGSFKSSVLIFNPIELLKSKPAKFKFITNDFQFPQGFGAKELIADGKINYSEKRVFDLSFNFERISSNKGGDPTVPEMAILINEYDLSSSFKEQSNVIKILAPKLTLDGQDLVISDLMLDASHKRGIVNIGVNLKQLDFNDGEVIVKKLALKNKLVLGFIEKSNTVDFKLAQLVSRDLDLKLSAVSGSLIGITQASKFSLVGRLDNYNISSQDQFIGEIKDANFELINDFKCSDRGCAVDTNGSLEIFSDPPILVKVKSISNLLGLTALPDCLKANCYISDISLNYVVNCEEGKLSGLLHCPTGDCLSSKVQHTIETSNTVLFFEAISQARIFNPFFLALLYGQVREGDTVGSGHRLSFD